MKPVRTYLSYAAIAGDVLFVAWLLFNGMDEGWNASPVQLASYLVLIALLALNAVLLWRARS